MALGRSGSLVFLSSGSRLLGLVLGESGESGRPFVYDIAAGTESADGPSEDGGSDGVVAYAFSPLGTYVAVTVDNKQLLLFRTRPWECLSVRSAVRRSTSLTITGAEDRILLADKSGDVYSFSISEPHRPGQLQLGHLSMLLAVAVSPDDRFVITADRDEKIRVSLLERPFVIEAFCLGHREFVSALFIPPNHPRLLVSGSGDGTVRLWEYENGKELHCFQLSEAQPSGCQEARCAVVRIVHCRRGDFFAVLCDGFSSVHVLELDVEARRLVHRQTIAVKRRAWDVAFDGCAGLWILDGDMAVLYQLQEGQWQKIPDHPEQRRIEEVIRANWAVFQSSAAEINYSNLYKMSIDTMVQYRLKKEQRLHKRQNKRELEMGKVTGDSKRMRVGDAAM